VEVALPCGRVALIDDEDWPKVAPYHWHSHKGKNGVTYVRSLLRQPDGRRRVLYLHRLVTGAPPEMEVDHGDHDGLNNRRGNLVVTDGCGNMKNSRRHRDNKSGVQGVSCDPRRGRWYAEIMVRGNRVRRSFATKDEAVEARREMENRRESGTLHAT
jgi:hypothetical protein